MCLPQLNNNIYNHTYNTIHTYMQHVVGSGVATGGKRGTPPPPPSIGHPVRSMQIRGDFHVGKNGG